MVSQNEFLLEEYGCGVHGITGQILAHLPPLPERGLLHLFIDTLSAGLLLCSDDGERPADTPHGPDPASTTSGDSLAHVVGCRSVPPPIKSALIGQTLTLPVVCGRLPLHAGRGICLCEFSAGPVRRRIVATAIG